MKRQKIKYLSEDEKRRLLASLKDRKSAERDYLLFNLMLNTGLRVSELASLSIGHVRERKSLEIVGKGNKVREVPINSVIKKHIEQYLAIKKRRKEGSSDSDPLFVSRKNGKLSVRAIQRALYKWITVAQIPTKFSPHALRHTFGTELFNKCKNIRLVQDVLGHADISTTMIYTHCTRADMEEAVELLAH